jgi:hypothetical protein
MALTDKALWIAHYDLPKSGRDDYLSWLHGSYIPRILRHPGMLWAAHYESHREPVNPPSVARILRHAEDKSMPTGNDYVLMFGAESAHAFARGANTYLKQAPDRLHADLSETDRKMLALRSGSHASITIEVARRNGPEAGRFKDSEGPSPCIQLGAFNIANVEWEDEVLAWFASWRFDAMEKLPGSVRIRHMVTMSGWAKHEVLYEFSSREARAAHFPNLRDAYPVESEWTTQRILPKLLHAPTSPFVGSRIWPPVR